MDIPSEDEVIDEACLEWILGEIRMVYDESDKHMMIDWMVKLLWWLMNGGGRKLIKNNFFVDF